MTTRDRAATALDLTLRHDDRGPRTRLARRRVAEALDLGRRPLAGDVEWLERVAAAGATEPGPEFPS